MTTLQYSVPPGLTDEQLDVFYKACVENGYMGAGLGSQSNSYVFNLSKIDRYGINQMAPNNERPGLTFFTKPTMNLTPSSVRQDRRLSMLDTNDPTMLQFSIRCYLDSIYARHPAISGLAHACDWYSDETPFIIPMTNNLLDFSGVPDFVIETETTDGGYYGEDLTFAKGSDMGGRTYEIPFTFRDIQGGYMYNLFYHWTMWQALFTQGKVVAYPRDRAYIRMPYTCSIYHFNMDPDNRYITKWWKGTGCFPKLGAPGSVFDVNRNDYFVSGAQTLTIPFVINISEPNDPIVLQDFNKLIRQYCGDTFISEISSGSRVKVDVMDKSTNCCGVPLINTADGGRNELAYFAYANELSNPYSTSMDSILTQLEAAIAGYTGLDTMTLT